MYATAARRAVDLHHLSIDNGDSGSPLPEAPCRCKAVVQVAEIGSVAALVPALILCCAAPCYLLLPAGILLRL